LGWAPVWHYSETIVETVNWYREYLGGANVKRLTDSQLSKYSQAWQSSGRD
jgi:hypothetical protein